MLEATFSRTTLPPGELPLGWFAIAGAWAEDQPAARHLRNRLCRIRSEHGTTYRTMRFAPGITVDRERQSGALAIDYQGWAELQGKSAEEPESLRLHIQIARPWEHLLAGARHPDPVVRLANRAATIGLLLGLLSLTFALLYIWRAA